MRLSSRILLIAALIVTLAVGVILLDQRPIALITSVPFHAPRVR
ncbi:MAG TPA: hypothetical protein VNW73_17265 [Ktedonobacteraceae bacterium]|jgi:hypothetical protein|nr:hypothetical protein [Ktedonobacteraceae bacterium]